MSNRMWEFLGAAFFCLLFLGLLGWLLFDVEYWILGW